MFRKQYILIRRGLPVHLPHGVNGVSGMLYGHMQFNKRFQGHMLAIDGGLWERSAGKDIMRQILRSRSATDYELFVDVDVDPESELGKVANELDAAKARIAELEAKLEGGQHPPDPIDAIPETVNGSPPPAIEPTAPPVVESTRPTAPALVLTPLPSQALPPNGNPTEELRTRLKGMPFRELRSMVVEAKAQGRSDAEVNKIKSHADMVEAALNIRPADALPV